MVLIMARGLGADIAAEYWNEAESFNKDEAPRKVITMGKQVKHRGLSYFFAQWRFFWKTSFIKNYDIVVFSGNNCLSAAWRCKKSQLKIMYCHTPVRYAYDLKDYYFKQKPLWQKLLFLFFVAVARVIYQWGIKKMDAVLCNSQNVQARLRKYCGVKSAVVYPPIISFCHPKRETSEEFFYKSAELDSSLYSTSPHFVQDDRKIEEYYLSFGRIDKLKRIDDIVRAFQKLPERNLVVASGGPELENIKKMAKDCDNIKVLGWVSDEQLAELAGNCIASIYIPIDEDFGMTPLEAAAVGKPTIGVDEGGLKETVLHKKTGYLMPKKYVINDLMEAVKWLDAEKAVEMKEDCIKQAEKFSKEIFIDKISKICKIDN